MANMADIPETDETQESGESREIKLAQTDTKTKQESTITDESRQKTWQQANTQGHSRDQHPSEIELPALVQSSFGIDFGDGQILTAKGIEQKEQIGVESSNWFESVKSSAKNALAALQKPQTEQTLIATNNIPTDPCIEQLQQFIDVETDSPEVIIANDLGDKLRQGYQGFRNQALSREVVRVMAPGVTDRLIFPYRGFEDKYLAECTKYNPHAWSQAYNSFPALHQFLSDKEATRLMQALVRNELHHYDPGDIAGDKNASDGQAKDSETLGYAQITPLGLRTFEQNYPQLKAFLTAKGYIGSAHEQKALEDPSCVPMIVGAKLQSIADFFKISHDKITGVLSVPVTAKTLAYAYNADVYYNPNNSKNPDFHANTLPKAKEAEHLRGYEKAYPTGDLRVLSKSVHVQNVESQYKFLH